MADVIHAPTIGSSGVDELLVDAAKHDAAASFLNGA
jgi:hypothetical protein